jgi:alanine racemase
MDVRTLRPAWAEVDLDALSHNIQEVRRLTSKDSLIMAAVKADAYGHGAVEASKVFLGNGADMLGVATLTEAIELREARIYAPILNFGHTTEEQFENLIENGISATIYTYRQARARRCGCDAREKGNRPHKTDTGWAASGFSLIARPSERLRRSTLAHIDLEGDIHAFAIWTPLTRPTLVVNSSCSCGF